MKCKVMLHYQSDRDCAAGKNINIDNRWIILTLQPPDIWTLMDNMGVGG